MGPLRTTVRTGTEWFPVDNPAAAGSIRRAAVTLAANLGMGESRVAETGIVATEVASNLAAHADNASIGLQVALRDDTLETWRSELDAAAALVSDERALKVLANPAIPAEGRAEVVRQLLGHKDIKTTIAFYAGAETVSAARHYQQTILRLQDTSRDPEARP